MTLDSWCAFLGPDMYLEICTNLGCVVESEVDQVKAAMDQSNAFQPKSSLESDPESAQYKVKKIIFIDKNIEYTFFGSFFLSLSIYF